MEYKFKEGESEKPAQERVLQKTGHVIEFSMLEIYRNLLDYDKVIREAKSNADNQGIVMANIEQHHPFVKEMPEFDRYTVHMYQEAFAKKKAWDKALKENEESRAELVAEIEEIKSKVPDLADIVSPFIEQPGKLPVENTEKKVDLEGVDNSPKTDERPGTKTE